MIVKQAIRTDDTKKGTYRKALQGTNWDADAILGTSRRIIQGGLPITLTPESLLSGEARGTAALKNYSEHIIT